MKTIEEAAEEYADKRVYHTIGVEHKDEFSMERRATKYDGYDIEQAFQDGAEYALANQWVRVEDKLPEDEELVLINHKNGDTMLAVWNERHQCWDDEYGDDVMYSDGITHWMPIPELKEK